jgi:hypothetical protein
MMRRLLMLGMIALCPGLAAACGSSGSSSSATSSAAGRASTTSRSAATATSTVDGISCAPVERLTYHIHAHLAVFDDGRPYALPTGIGIPGSTVQQTQYGPLAGAGRCIYWLHTHTSDGIIHIESPTKRIYSLGNFFDVWRQPLSATQIASLHGPVRAFVNGQPWTRSPRAIPLLPHEDIQLEIGHPAPPNVTPIVTVNWSATQL